MATSTGTISSSGIGSGLNVDDIVTKLMQVEQQPLVALQNREAQYTSQLTTLGTIKGTLSSFQTAADALKTAGATAAYKVSSSDASITGSANSTSAAGVYNVSVTQLAKAQRLATAGQSALGTIIGDGTPTSLTLSFGSITGGTLDNVAGTYSGATFTADPTRTPVTIQLDNTDNTLEGIRDAINAANAGVTAAIVNDGSASPYRLTITSNSTGLQNSVKIGVTGSAGIATLLANDPAGTQNLQQTQAGADAKLTISGLAISSPNNSISGAIQGVTLKLTALTTDATISIDSDTTPITKALQGIVDAYNDVNTAIKGATGLQQILQGDSTTVGILNRLRSSLGAILSNGAGSITSLSQLGVTFEKDGSLSFDSTVAQGAIQADPDAVAKAVATFGTSLSTLTNSLAGSGGALDSRTDGINASIKRLTDQGDALSVHLKQIEARYRAQYTALDVLMASMQTTSNFLTQQLANLPKTSNSNN